MSPPATVRVEDCDGIALVTLDRPPANAVVPDLIADGLEVLRSLTTEPPAAVVLTGAGDFFCGGADLRVVPTLSPEAQGEMARGINELFAGWHGFARPLVCAVNGHAVAGGLVLALCGDHRVVATSGRYGLTEVKVGIPFPSAAMAVVQAELTPSVARRLVLRGELFDSVAATELGLFDEVVPDAEVMARSLEVARQLAAMPPRTYEAVKRRLRARAMDTPRNQFGGAASAGWVTEEAATAAPSVLDDR